MDNANDFESLSKPELEELLGKANKELFALQQDVLKTPVSERSALLIEQSTLERRIEVPLSCHQRD